MSDASDSFENALALLFFNATPWTNVADNASSSPVTSWYAGLHTSSPADGGNQSTNEIGYTSYTRVAIARSSGGFSVSAGVASLASNVDFPAGTGGSGTASHLSLGNAASGAGTLQLHGSLSPSIVCGNAITPRLTTATTFTIA